LKARETSIRLAVVGAKPEARPRLVALASGKGGVGKTLTAANVGIFLATLGKRVILVDAALGSAAIHTFVGIDRPSRSLRELWSQGGVELAELVTPTPVPGLSLVTSELEPGVAGGAPCEHMARLVTELRGLSADFVILDLATGPEAPILDLFLGADVGAVVMSPDPAAVELGYIFLRAAFARRLAKVGLASEMDLHSERMRHFAGGVAAPRDMYDVAKERSETLAARLEEEMLALRARIIINNARSKADMDIGSAIASAAFRRLGLPLSYLGHVEYDDAAWVSLRRRRPLLIEHPESRAAKCIEKLSRRLLARESDRPLPSITVGDSHYDLFDVEPTASEEDIRRANRHTRAIYAKNSVVVGGLYSAAQLEALHLRLDEAYDTLMDPAKRKAYDQALFPGGVPVSATATSAPSRGGLGVLHDTPPPEERPPMPELDPDTEFTGPLLQRIRESRGIDLREIAERTKIGMPYLAAIEAENFDKLPAVVYVRGFLDQYVRLLGLDPERVLDTYLPRYESARAQVEPTDPP
jgi:flagellar biosynthesis protein FlhG